MSVGGASSSCAHESAPWGSSALAARYGADEECEVVSESDVDSEFSDDLGDEDLDAYGAAALAQCTASLSLEGTDEGSKEVSLSQSQLVGLIARLRCDNLEMHEALAEASREAENATAALAREREENGRLLAEVERLQRAGGGGGGPSSRPGPGAARDAAAGGSDSGAAPREASALADANRAGEEGEAAPVDGLEPLGGIVQRVRQLKEEAQHEREQRLALEQVLVRSKVRCKEASDRAEALEELIHGNPEALRAQGAATSPEALQALGTAASPGVRRGESTSSGLSVDSKPMKKKGIKKLVGRMLGAGHGASALRDKVEDNAGEEGKGSARAGGASKEDIDSQKEVVNVLVSELKRARKKAHKLKAKIQKRKDLAPPGPTRPQ